MLILTRDQINDPVLIGEDIEVSVSKTSSGQIRLAIQAPKEVNIVRKELLETEPQAVLDYLRFILSAIAHFPHIQILEVSALLLLITLFGYRYRNHLPITAGQFFTEGRVLYNGEEYSGGRRPTPMRSVYVIYEVDGKRFERQGLESSIRLVRE